MVHKKMSKAIISMLCPLLNRTMPEKIVKVHRYPIRLGQFLKLAEIVQDGLEAKFMILEGEVQVNGKVELRRGRQLHCHDVVTFQQGSWRCG